MGNTPIQIGLKCDKQTYHSGETMTGTVYVSVSSITPAIQQYQGIRLALDGNETTEVRIRESSSSGGDNSTRIRTERESTSLLHIEVPLTMFASPLRVAKYEFPFEWKLPSSQLPSSFKHRNAGVDGKGFCEVRYTLSAFLIPQAQSGGMFGMGMGNNNRSTYASQTIQLIGAPTRDIPEPLHIAEERTVINGLCCCWKQGHVSLGWEADSIVLAPNATCQMQLWGSNTSNLPVHGLRIQLLQTVEWQAGHEYSNQQRHARKDTTTLVDYKVDVSHLPQWDPLTQNNNSNNSYAAVTQQQQGNQPIPTTFQVPPDVLDSYQGMHCKIEHALVVTAVTRLLATTPTVSYKVHLQRYDNNNTSNNTMPVATAWMEESEFQDVVLPPDWSPDEKVPVIVLEQVQTVDDDDGNYNTTQNAKAVTMATAQAVMVEPVMASSASATTPAVTLFGHGNNNQHNDGMISAAAAAADPFAYRDDPTDDPLAFARPSAPPMEMDTGHGTKY